MITIQQLEKITNVPEVEMETTAYVMRTWGIDLQQCDPTIAMVIDRFARYGAAQAMMQIICEVRHEQEQQGIIK